MINRLGDIVDGCVAVIGRVEEAGVLPAENAVGLAPYGVGAVVDTLDAANIGEGRVVAVSRGYKLQGAIKTAERKLAAGELRHGGQLMMAWAVGNAKVEVRGSAATITKQASGTAKIDPLMSLFDALALMSGNPSVPNAVSVYEEKGCWFCDQRLDVGPGFGLFGGGEGFLGGLSGGGGDGRLATKRFRWQARVDQEESRHRKPIAFGAADEMPFRPVGRARGTTTVARSSRYGARSSSALHSERAAIEFKELISTAQSRFGGLTPSIHRP